MATAVRQASIHVSQKELIKLICLQRRYLSLCSSAQAAYNAGHKDEFKMLLPLANALQEEIDKRFAKLPKKLVREASESDLQWVLGR